ncbi:hypothetical protein PMAYCL1PPCAC_21803, partial [Pristionchus mayeri]
LLDVEVVGCDRQMEKISLLCEVVETPNERGVPIRNGDLNVIVVGLLDLVVLMLLAPLDDLLQDISGDVGKRN